MPLGGLLVAGADPADDQPGGDLLFLLRRERGVPGLGDLGVGDPVAGAGSSQMACGYSIAVHASSGMPAIAARILEFIGTVTEKCAPLRRTVPITAAL